MSLEHSQSDAISDHDELPQSNLDLPQQYKLLCKINEGGMGAIYKAQNRYTGATFAIKVVKPEYAHDEEVRHRFIIEARAASSLKHPHICQIHDFGITTTKQMPYMVMDWIDGISLGKKIMRDGALSSSEAVQIFQQVTNALAHAHHNKVVHRDLKPDNIMLSKSDNQGRTSAYLVDFGIAKLLAEEGDLLATQGLTKTGVVVGTPLFMSPEQARGKTVDRRSDIYSLGCVMYFALTGSPPFIGDSTVDTIHMHMNAVPQEFAPQLKISRDLRMIVLKAMEKLPEDRYQTADQIGIDLKKLTKGVNIELGTLASEREKLRQRWKVALFFLIGFVVMFGISIALQNFLNVVSPESKTSPTQQQTTVMPKR